MPLAAKLFGTRLFSTMTSQATFAAGCFWGTEKFFKKFLNDKGAFVDGKVGYTGGQKPNPSYKEVCTGTTGHAEAYTFRYDPTKADFGDLCRHFFRFHDPTTANRQGNDIGSQYRSAIFYHSPEQKTIAENVKKECQSKFRDPIVTEIVPATTFYDAEDYHQEYLDNNPGGYCNHRFRW